MKSDKQRDPLFLKKESVILWDIAVEAAIDSMNGELDCVDDFIKRTEKFRKKLIAIVEKNK